MERYEDKGYEQQVDKSGPRNRNDNRRNSSDGEEHFNKGLLAIRKACKSYSFDSLRVELWGDMANVPLRSRSLKGMSYRTALQYCK